MTPIPFVLPNWFDYGATFLFAIAGTLLALRRGYDVVGVLTVAFAGSVGGGLIRDGIFLQQGPPGITMNGSYLLLITLGALTGVLFQRFVPRLQLLIEIVDALGLGAYAVVGCNKALMAGFALPAVVLVGIINAVGGGILRDILTREEPLIFRPGQFYVAAAFAGCITFVSLNQLSTLGHYETGFLAIGVTFTLRALAIRFNWQTSLLSPLEPEAEPALASTAVQSAQPDLIQ
jgi:uncharacterized membrane protein YeiH